MWMARNFPGASGGMPMLDYVESLTPEQTLALVEQGKEILSTEQEERFSHTRVIAAASGLRIR